MGAKRHSANGKIRTGVGAVLMLSIVASGCGGADSAQSVVDGLETDTTIASETMTPSDPTTPDAATPDAATPDAATPDAATPDAATPDAATPDTNAPPTTSGASDTTQPSTPPPTAATSTLPDGAEGSAALSSALLALEEVVAYRVATSTATTLVIPALGISNQQELDLDRPLTLQSVDADGEIHSYLDLGPTFAALATPGTDPALAAALDLAHVELWLSDDRLVIDASGYAPLAELNRTADLGPFAPGIGAVYLDQVEEVGGEELLGVLVGSAPVDPVMLGRRLPEALVDIEQSGPTTFSAEATYSDLVAALGGDVEQSSLGAAVGIAQALGLDPQALGAFYADFFRITPAMIAIELTPDGVLESVLIAVDLSAMYDQLFTVESGLFPTATEAELTDARDQFAGVEFMIETSVRFEIDSTIQVELPGGELENRTDLALAYLESVS